MAIEQSSNGLYAGRDFGAAEDHPILIFDTHPIQYRSPVFKSLAEKVPSLRVFYFSETFQGGRWWFHERNKTPKQNWGLELKEGFVAETLNISEVSIVSKFLTLHRIIRRYRPTTVVIYGYYLVENWLLRIICRAYGTRITFVGETFEMSSKGFRYLLKRLFLKRFFFGGIDHFLAIGTRTRSYYSALGISKQKIVSTSYCVDNSFFQVSPQEAENLREKTRTELGIPKDAFVLLFVGRLFDRKRPLDVLKVHQRFAQSKRFHTLLVGNGEMEDVLRKAGAGIPNLFLTGFKNQAELREIYYASDVLFVPSEYETWGLVVNEAAVCGLPSVVTDRTGVAGDLIEHGETGFVVPVGSVEEAEKGIRALFADGELLAEMADRVKRKVLSEYTPEAFAEAIYQIGILDGKRDQQSLLATR